MRRLALHLVWGFVVISGLLTGCSSGRTDLSRASSQLNFGVKSARLNLWREALFRFRRATEIDPGSAIAANNLAVAYEGNGEFEKARTTYLEALRLDRTNQYIQKNYSRFTEFYARNKKREAKTAEAAKASSEPSAPAPAVAGAPAPAVAEPTPAKQPEVAPPQPPVSSPPSSAKPDGGIR